MFGNASSVRCLETRKDKDGFRRRRYQLDQLILKTIEVPVELWNRVNTQGRSRNRVAEVLRSLNRDAQFLEVKLQQAAGWTVAESASEMQLPIGTVKGWRRLDNRRRVA